MSFGSVHAAAVAALPHRSRNRSLNAPVVGMWSCTLRSTRNRANSTGIWMISGRQPESGLTLFSLVELHQLFVLLLAVVLVLRLDLLDLGLDALHRDHRPRLLRGQRQQQRHHRAGEQDDRDARGSG